MRDWAVLTGAPPGAADWQPSRLRDDLVRLARHLDDTWPRSKTVYDWFGTWENALLFAGFAPGVARLVASGHIARCVTLLRKAGFSTGDVAALLGVQLPEQSRA
jgi:hypothetical protein